MLTQKIGQGFVEMSSQTELNESLKKRKILVATSWFKKHAEKRLWEQFSRPLVGKVDFKNLPPDQQDLLSNELVSLGVVLDSDPMSRAQVVQGLCLNRTCYHDPDILPYVERLIVARSLEHKGGGEKFWEVFLQHDQWWKVHVRSPTRVSSPTPPGDSKTPNRKKEKQQVATRTFQFSIYTWMNSEDTKACRRTMGGIEAHITWTMCHRLSVIWKRCNLHLTLMYREVNKSEVTDQQLIVLYTFLTTLHVLQMSLPVHGFSMESPKWLRECFEQFIKLEHVMFQLESMLVHPHFQRFHQSWSYAWTKAMMKTNHQLEGNSASLIKFQQELQRLGDEKLEIEAREEFLSKHAMIEEKEWLLCEDSAPDWSMWANHAVFERLEPAEALIPKLDTKALTSRVDEGEQPQANVYTPSDRIDAGTKVYLTSLADDLKQHKYVPSTRKRKKEEGANEDKGSQYKKGKSQIVLPPLSSDLTPKARKSKEAGVRPHK